MTRAAHATDDEFADLEGGLPPDVEFDLATLNEAPAVVSGDEDEALPPDVEFDLAIAQSKTPSDEVLGADLASTPAFKNEIARRVAGKQALMATRQSRPRQRQFDFGTGQVWAPAGATTTITINPQCVFRVEEMAATDTAGGNGTSIVQVAIGQKIQRPGSAGQGTLTQFFAQNALANGIMFDTAHPWEDIAITVSFNQACTFSMNLYGTADID